MTEHGKPPSGIFLTAAQSMQGFNAGMRLQEQANNESTAAGHIDQGSSQQTQQAPSVENYDDAGTGNKASS